MKDRDCTGVTGVDSSGAAAPIPTHKPGHTEPLSRAALMTVGEASKYLGYKSDRRLWNLRAANSGPRAIKLPSGGVRYRIEDLEAWAFQVVREGEPDLRPTGPSKAQGEKQALRRARDLERQRARRAAEKEVKS